VVRRTTNLSFLKIVYGFNPLTPLDILPLLDIISLFHNEGISRAEFVKRFLEKIKEQIEKQTQKYVEYKSEKENDF